MDPATPTVLQTGPETFDVWVAGYRLRARLPHHTRRGLGLQGVAPVQIVVEIAALLQELGEVPAGEDEVDLGRAVGRFPQAIEELRVRLT